MCYSLCLEAARSAPTEVFCYAGGRSEAVVRLRGLPFAAREADVAQFVRMPLSSRKPASVSPCQHSSRLSSCTLCSSRDWFVARAVRVTLTSDPSGRPSGEAFVVLPDAQVARCALHNVPALFFCLSPQRVCMCACIRSQLLQLHQKKLGARVIEVFASNHRWSSSLRLLRRAGCRLLTACMWICAQRDASQGASEQGGWRRRDQFVHVHSLPGEQLSLAGPPFILTIVLVNRVCRSKPPTPRLCPSSKVRHEPSLSAMPQPLLNVDCYATFLVAGGSGVTPARTVRLPGGGEALVEFSTATEAHQGM